MTTVLTAVDIPTGRSDERLVRVSGLPHNAGHDTVATINSEFADLCVFEVDWKIIERRLQATVPLSRVMECLKALRRAVVFTTNGDVIVSFTDRNGTQKVIMTDGSVRTGTLEAFGIDDSVVNEATELVKNKDASSATKPTPSSLKVPKRPLNKAEHQKRLGRHGQGNRGNHR